MQNKFTPIINFWAHKFSIMYNAYHQESNKTMNPFHDDFFGKKIVIKESKQSLL